MDGDPGDLAVEQFEIAVAAPELGAAWLAAEPDARAALIPLLFLTLGTTLKSEIFLASFGAFWPLLVQTMYGVRDVERLLQVKGPGSCR